MTRSADGPDELRGDPAILSEDVPHGGPATLCEDAYDDCVILSGGEGSSPSADEPQNDTTFPNYSQ